MHVSRTCHYLKYRPKILLPIKLKLNSVAFSPHANYTDRATAALSAKLVLTFSDKVYHVVSATDPYGR
jgi:hypothetical protein